MSLATLKKKTQTQYNNMSVGSKNGGFSLNGTRRSQGYVGQTMLGRHFPSTPMRGNEARGSGGCCGTYYKGTIIQSGVCFPTNHVNGSSANNDPRAVKTSVLSNTGMIRTQYKWIWRPQPYTSVKVDANLLQGTQQMYIANKSANLVSILDASCNKISVACKSSICNNLQLFKRPRPNGTVIPVTGHWTNVTKSGSQMGTISQKEFIETLTGGCVKNNVKSFTSVKRAPLPGPSASF